MLTMCYSGAGLEPEPPALLRTPAKSRVITLASKPCLWVQLAGHEGPCCPAACAPLTHSPKLRAPRADNHHTPSVQLRNRSVCPTQVYSEASHLWDATVKPGSFQEDGFALGPNFVIEPTDGYLGGQGVLSFCLSPEKRE